MPRPARSRHRPYKGRRGGARLMEDIYAPPSPEEVARMIAELESGAYDETLRQARLAYNRKFPHRKMDVGYGLKPRSDRRNTDTEDEGFTNQHGQPTTEAPGYPPKEKHD